MRSKKVIILIFLILIANLMLNGTTLNVPADYATIQEAHDAALAGDVINVAAGVYHNDIHFITKQLTFLGAQAGVDPAGAVSRGEESILTRDDEYTIWVQPGAAGTIIDGFKFGNDTPETGRRVHLNDVEDVTIKNNIFYRPVYNNVPGMSTGHGISVHFESHGAQVLNNTVYDSSSEGIINHGASGVLIDGNYIRNVEWTAMQINGPTVVSNNIIQTCYDGIIVEYPVTNEEDGVEITNNTISYVRYAGINIHSGSDIGAYSYIHDNVINNCNYWGDDGTPDWDYASIHLEAGAHHSVIEGNEVYDGINGIQVWADNVTISENEIYNFGLSYPETATQDGYEYNNSAVIVGSNWDSGNYDPALTITVENNSIHDNYWGLYYSEVLPGTVLATPNYWGAEDGPSGAFDGTGAPVSEGVSVLPFWINAEMTTLSATNIIQERVFAEGWNLWSYNVELDDNVVGVVFADVTNLTKVKSITESYDPALAITNPNFNTLTELVNGYGYWVQVSQEDSLELTGNPIPVSTTSIALISGWNLVAFLPQDAEEVEFAFDALINGGELVKVKSITQSYDPALAITNPQFNTLQTVFPGNGYWVNVNADVDFIYPVPPVRSIDLEYTAMEFIWTPEIYTNSTCAYAMINESYGQVGAFVKGECRGVTAINDGCVSLVINGEAAETVNFKLFQNGVVTDLNKQITTVPGADVFFEFTADEASIATQLLSVYPNPFNPETTIAYDLATESDVNISVYNVKGQKITELVNEKQDAGQHNIVWNAVNQASGIYFLNMNTGDINQIQKLILMK